MEQSDAQLGIQGTIDVVDGEKGRRVRARKKRDVEEEEEEPLVRASLVEQGLVRKVAIPNPDASLAWAEIFRNNETLKPIDQGQLLLDLHQAIFVCLRVKSF